ncbi:MAG: hypothetical protein ABIJ47_00480 [Candidatus Bathyarchaeota archaeon]
MNWVLLVGGLIPLWTALMIVYMNKSVSRPRPPRVEAQPDDDYPYDYEEPEAKPRRSLLGALRGVNLGALKGLKSKIPRRKVKEAAPEETPYAFEEEDKPPAAIQAQAATSLGLDLSSEKRMWGITLLVLAGACLMNGFYMTLDYIFREYRTLMGMKLPLAGELRFLSGLSLVVLGFCVVASAAKTGIKLVKS